MKALVAARLRPGDRMRDHDAVIGQQLMDLVEVSGEISDADMLEHADGDDAVRLSSLQQPVVLQLEADAVGKTALSALAGDLQLLLALSVMPVKSTPSVDSARYIAHAAPARPISSTRAGSARANLGGDVPLLGDLRLHSG